MIDLWWTGRMKERKEGERQRERETTPLAPSAPPLRFPQPGALIGPSLLLGAGQAFV